MSVDRLKEDFVVKLNSNGEDRFYRSLLFLAVNKLVLIENNLYKGTLPHLEYLNYYETFLFLYRREGDEIFLKIARMLRKASHKIYRLMLKKNMTTLNDKFLNRV